MSKKSQDKDLVAETRKRIEQRVEVKASPEGSSVKVVAG